MITAASSKLYLREALDIDILVNPITFHTRGTVCIARGSSGPRAVFIITGSMA